MVPGWGPPALNHVELVHRPGERALAVGVLELLGCTAVDRGGTWVSAFVDGARIDAGDSNNVLYVSEVTAEQWALDQELALAFRAEGPLGDAWARFATRMRSEPQRSSHFGIRCTGRADFDARLARVRAAAATPALDGRLAVVGEYHPGQPGAASTTLAQGFIWTDVVASGALSLGQHIEVQWQVDT